MKRIFPIILLTIACLSFEGCNKTQPTPVVAASPTESKMTLETWNGLEENIEKYDPALIERLRKEEPKFKSATEWKKFKKDVVTPGIGKVLGRAPGGK